jgi:diguanylate cyclase
LAEKSGLVGQLTEAVAASAIADAARWHQAGHLLSVTINLSHQSLHDHRTTSQLLHLLDLADLPPSALRVEVTEQALLDDPAVACLVLSQLRTAGTEVSIDDFGTGHSSLSLLRQLPIDELKIDGSFVTSLSPHDTSLVRSIIDLGHALGLRVVAEGIETALVRDILIGLGCDRGQGYFLGQPMTPDEFFNLVISTPRAAGRRTPAQLSDSAAGVATVTHLAARRAVGPAR